MARRVLNVNDGAKGRLSLYVAGDSDFNHIGEVGIKLKQAKPEPELWLLSDKKRKDLELEKRNLIRAKVKAIVGTAVMGAFLAVALGVLIGTHRLKN